MIVSQAGICLSCRAGNEESAFCGFGSFNLLVQNKKTTTLQTHISHIYSNGVRQCIFNYSSSGVAYHGGAQEGVRVKTKLC